MHTTDTPDRRMPPDIDCWVSSEASRSLSVLEPTQANAHDIVEVFQQRARDRGGELAYAFLAEGEETERRSYAEMDRWARSIAAELQRRELPGQRALLVFDPGLDYVAALAGCLYAGVTAVPAYPPDPLRVQRTLSRLQRIVHDSRAAAVLTTSAVASRARGLLTSLPGLEHGVLTDEIAAGLGKAWARPEIAGSDLALIQYTSGSTGNPKGVMISHANLLANLSQIHRHIDRPDNVVVSWLPAYHDMGLICILQLWYSCRPLIMMSPLSFFQRPLRWLQAITDFRATLSPSPNFGYDLCVRKTDPRERSSLDLSSWAVALNGAEPVRPATIERFCEAFGPYGMRREAFCPAYGMAETTLMIAARKPLSGPSVASFDCSCASRAAGPSRGTSNSRSTEAGLLRPARARSPVDRCRSRDRRTTAGVPAWRNLGGRPEHSRGLLGQRGRDPRGV